MRLKENKNIVFFNSASRERGRGANFNDSIKIIERNQSFHLKDFYGFFMDVLKYVENFMDIAWM